MSIEELLVLNEEIDRIKTEIAVMESEQKKALKEIEDKFGIKTIKDMRAKVSELKQEKEKHIKRKDKYAEQARELLETLE